MKKVLSLSGGGTSGYMTAGFIDKIEEATGKKLCENIDLIGGVSTGAIIGSFLNYGMTGKEIQYAYKSLYKTISVEQPKLGMFIKMLFGSVYDINDLKKQLEGVYGDMALSHCNIPFMCHALRISKPSLRPVFWKSWESNNSSFLLKDVVAASSCAPLLFKPSRVAGEYFYDGGLVINEPSVSTAVEAMDMFGDDFKLLSIQTDFHKGFDKPQKQYGILRLGTNIMSLFTDGSERSHEYIAKKILKDRYKVLNPNIYFDIDDGNFEKMDTVIEKAWEEKGDEILKFFSE